MVHTTQIDVFGVSMGSSIDEGVEGDDDAVLSGVASLAEPAVVRAAPLCRAAMRQELTDCIDR